MQAADEQLPRRHLVARLLVSLAVGRAERGLPLVCLAPRKVKFVAAVGDPDGQQPVLPDHETASVHGPLVGPAMVAATRGATNRGQGQARHQRFWPQGTGAEHVRGAGDLLPAGEEALHRAAFAPLLRCGHAHVAKALAVAVAAVVRFRAHQGRAAAAGDAVVHIRPLSVGRAGQGRGGLPPARVDGCDIRALQEDKARLAASSQQAGGRRRGAGSGPGRARAAARGRLWGKGRGGAQPCGREGPHG
mmetsp:Transcript_109101/g.308489  ORF Transcript_109101/g.308489 Transcript_109101/m.308489 type:complete len:247 (-) Transcript_109101:85-825(-)